MEIKLGSGLDFVTDDSAGKGVTNDSGALQSIREIIRDGYRAPVGNDDKISLTIDGSKYRAFNLSSRGIGIFVNELSEFSRGSTFTDVELEINGNKFTVNAKIVHISRDVGNCLCGVELSNLDPECDKALTSYLEKSKNVLFS